MFHLDSPWHSYLYGFYPGEIKDHVPTRDTSAASHLNSVYCHVFVSNKLVFDGEPCLRTCVIILTFTRSRGSHTNHATAAAGPTHVVGAELSCGMDKASLEGFGKEKSFTTAGLLRFQDMKSRKSGVSA